MKINDQRILRNGNIVNLALLDRRAEALVIWKGERIGVGVYQEIRQHMEDFSLAPLDDENYPITIDACHDSGQTTIIKH